VLGSHSSLDVVHDVPPASRGCPSVEEDPVRPDARALTWKVGQRREFRERLASEREGLLEPAQVGRAGEEHDYGSAGHGLALAAWIGAQLDEDGLELRLYTR